MSVELLRIVESRRLDTEQISAHSSGIHRSVLEKSRVLDDANFTVISEVDLETLFVEYDQRFFEGTIHKSLATTPLNFKLSGRMTSSGGKTARYTDRVTGRHHYEISVSTVLLFGCFDDDDHRPISCSGIECRNRLDALQRVMEHELVHLIEMLLWNRSSCKDTQFHSITWRLFGHTENTHRLITPREKAVVQYGIRPGMRVRFQMDGDHYEGLVNRITRRATVLVEDRNGQPYSDGKRYAKFYVPVDLLEPVG